MTAIRAFIVVAIVALASAASEAATKPNFIVINIDDLGYADIGPFGSNNRTPNLDRMAKEGRKLTCHYAAPVCSPSRAALMTGCYPKRVLPIPGVLFPAGAVGLNPNETTIAEILRDADYATACIGKWHLGDQPEFLPTRQGFDYYYGIPYSNDMGPAADGSKSSLGQPLPTRDAVVAKTAKAKPQESAETGIVGSGQPPLPLFENEKVIDRVRGPEQQAIVKRYTEKAVRFIRDKREQPFFLYLPHSAVHFPHYPSQEYVGKSPNGLVGDWAEEIDWGVGQVLDVVRELNLSERTLVIFTSDNGGPIQQGAKNTPLRAGKGTTFEGGMRVCTIAWWPGKIPAGTSTDAMTSMMDILPTLANLAGGKIPADRKIDGVDVWPVLAGTSGAIPPRDEFYFYRGLALEAVRSGPWKLHLSLADGPAGKNKGGAGKPQLFHMIDDLGESKNVAAEHQDIVARLQAMAEATKGDLALNGIGPGCRPLGRVADPQPLIDNDGVVRAGFVGAKSRFP
ncbi:MAG TPA: sulfatase [Pirellulaceae bacterium]